MRNRLATLVAACLSAPAAFATPVIRDLPAPPPALSKALPETIDDLKAVQDHVRKLTEKIVPTTVCLQVGMASGSGVIVSKDGLILTAGHVSGEPGKKITVLMHDGKKLEGITLGFNPKIDSGMAKITTPGEYPYTEMGKSGDLKAGQWCVCVGHPGGIKKDRPPVLRVGRIGNPKYIPRDRSGTYVQTDCTLVGGDSGGPLFDVTGKVIGIHSRIDMMISENMDVPVDQYTTAWEGLKNGEVLGVSPYLGVQMDDTAKECKLGGVTARAPAANAGLKLGDVITKLDGKDVASYDEMVGVLKTLKPLREVSLTYVRGTDEPKEVKVKIGYRAE